ncbi:YitT family protein [Anaerovorax odorimutans]|uniref:YitT family protein n=1 Tax=Anaerovorax odorimutans TaxID=109327 RepID=A0ABT1RMZ8_9FIRM|nr:YitT family protein [Anaerovorax odorimutans]MCQ4636560.1 YitT family protein [Anaerovorax odorimutans]
MGNRRQRLLSQKQRNAIRETFRKERIKAAAADSFFLLIACCLGAFSTVGVMIPNGLTSGGLTGIVRIVQNFVPLDFSLLYYGGSIVILIVAVIFLGLREFRKILLLTIVFPAAIFVFEKLDLQLLEDKDILLAAVFCGVFSGVCVGLVFWRGYSFSGTEAIAKILKKKLFPHYSLSKILLAIDGVIIAASAFIFGRNIALYALITQVIISRMVDIVMYGFETKIVRLEIITSQKQAVSRYIIEDIRRGVSSMEITGEYTKNQYTQLSVMCSPRESILVKRKVAELDKKALVTVLPVETVWGTGEGFNDLEKDQ